MLLRSIYKTTNNVIIRPNIQHLQKCNKSTLQTILSDQLQEIRDAGTYKVERVITSPQSSMISVQNMDNDVINFCANNYLGLSNDPELVEAAKATLDSHGFGLSSVRFICYTRYQKN